MSVYSSTLPFAEQKKKQKVLEIVLPVFLLLSFIWLNLYTTMTDINTAVHYFFPTNSLSFYLLGNVLLKGIFDYLVFEMLFFVYRFCLGFSIYSFMIPKDVLKNKFRFWYIIRNLILGFIFNIRFFFPYFATYACIFEMLFNMLKFNDRSCPGFGLLHNRRLLSALSCGHGGTAAAACRGNRCLVDQEVDQNVNHRHYQIH